MGVRRAAILLAALLAASVQAGTLVRMESNLGTFEMELFDTNTPVTANNFLSYVNSGRFDGTIIHRSVPGFIVQAGGFAVSPDGIRSVPSFGTITNEPGISNLRGTVAMAKVGGNPHSATSQWFVNLADNSANLDFQNEGFTVVGKIFGNGMRVADSISAVPRYNASSANPAFDEIPLLGATNAEKILVFIQTARSLPSSAVAVSYDFSSGDHGFSAGFADLPADYDESLYDLQHGHRDLPANLGGGKALFISGANRSDGLWMYWKKQITGLMPGKRYE